MAIHLLRMSDTRNPKKPELENGKKITSGKTLQKMGGCTKREPWMLGDGKQQ